MANFRVYLLLTIVWLIIAFAYAISTDTWSVLIFSLASLVVGYFLAESEISAFYEGDPDPAEDDEVPEPQAFVTGGWREVSDKPMPGDISLQHITAEGAVLNVDHEVVLHRAVPLEILLQTAGVGGSGTRDEFEHLDHLLRGPGAWEGDAGRPGDSIETCR